MVGRDFVLDVFGVKKLPGEKENQGGFQREGLAVKGGPVCGGTLLVALNQLSLVLKMDC